MRKHKQHILPKNMHIVSAQKYYKVNAILIGEFNVRKLIFKKNNICTQPKVTDFSYEVLEQVFEKKSWLG